MHLNETFRFCYDYMYIFLINTIPSSPLSPLNTSFAVVFAAKKTNKSNDLLKAQNDPHPLSLNNIKTLSIGQVIRIEEIIGSELILSR